MEPRGAKMQIRMLAICGAAASLAACGQGDGGTSANQLAAAPKEKPKYCFFKDAESKDWTASRGKDGNITVKGKLYRSDGRYMAVLGEPKIKGSTVEYWPNISINNTGASMPDGWWEVSATVSNSAAIDTIDVNCGAKAFAELKVAAAS
jgi:hypothetical protein